LASRNGNHTIFVGEERTKVVWVLRAVKNVDAHCNATKANGTAQCVDLSDKADNYALRKNE
jgi:hypothetical protein